LETWKNIEEKVGRGWGWGKKIGFLTGRKVGGEGATRTFYIYDNFFVTIGS
tara:strand:- start:419 stop:571 length:153 start_codon:yes stop_codon:yes gene_type:complete